MSEKTEQPTSQRLREARKKGQIAKSRMLSSSAVTMGGLFGFLAFAPESAARFEQWTASMLEEGVVVDGTMALNSRRRCPKPIPPPAGRPNWSGTPNSTKSRSPPARNGKG